MTYSSQKQICLSKATIAMWEVAPTEKVFWLSTNSLLFVAFCRSIDLSLRNFDTPTDTGPTTAEPIRLMTTVGQSISYADYLATAVPAKLATQC